MVAELAEDDARPLLLRRHSKEELEALPIEACFFSDLVPEKGSVFSNVTRVEPSEDEREEDITDVYDRRETTEGATGDVIIDTWWVTNGRLRKYLHINRSVIPAGATPKSEDLLGGVERYDRRSKEVTTMVSYNPEMEELLLMPIRKKK